MTLDCYNFDDWSKRLLQSWSIKGRENPQNTKFNGLIYTRVKVGMPSHLTCLGGGGALSSLVESLRNESGGALGVFDGS